MALGLEVALVLRAKGGANFLMHTHGIGAKDANEATREAIERLDAFAQRDGRGDRDGSGDCAPGFSAGRLAVCRGRLLVNYRLVGAIWVLSVSPAAANALLCVQLIAAVTRVLVAAAKGPDVTPDKLARRYPEVYLALGQALAPGGLAADAAALLAGGEADVAAIAPEGAPKPKAAGSLKSRLGAMSGRSGGGGGKGMSASNSSSSLHSGGADASTPAARPLSEEGERMGVASFTLPPGALAGGQPASLAGLPAAAAASAAEPPLLGAGADLLSGTGLEGLDAPPPSYDQQLSSLLPPQLAGAGQGPWGGLDAGQAAAAAGPVAAPPPPPPPRPQLPPATAKQQKAIGSGGALQLVEVWRALFVGSKLHAAGTACEVLGTGAVPRCEAAAAFQLSAAGGATPRSVAACARAASGEPGLTSHTEAGAALACFGEAPSPEAAFARFQLPAAAVPPPLLLAVSLAARPDASRPPRTKRALPASGDGAVAAAEAEAGAEMGAGAAAAPAEASGGQAGGAPGAAAEAGSPTGDAGEGAAAAAAPQGAGGGGGPEADVAVAKPAGPQQLLIAVTVAVRPDLPGPLRGACLDLDVPAACGELLSARPRAQWAPRQRRLRWKLYELAPGAIVRLAARLQRPAPRADAATLCAATLASLHAFGPPGLGLSGVQLLSGAPGGELQASRQAFHCEVHARPEAAKARTAFGPRDFAELGALVQERQAAAAQQQRELEGDSELED